LTRQIEAAMAGVDVLAKKGKVEKLRRSVNAGR
jgi:hypothetical protein